MLLTALLPACTATQTPLPATLTPAAILPSNTASPSPARTATRTLSPLPPTVTFTPSPTLTLTPTRTPPELPAAFTTKLLDASILPQAYIPDVCQYLKARWDPNNSPPGTAVMVIMYHSVTEDSAPIQYDTQIHHSDLIKALEYAHSLGFQTITSAQLADFLEKNAPIPQLSLLIIVDDRKTKYFYQTHFIPTLQQFHWTITNAWISAADTPEIWWQENAELQQSGWVDHQAHGVVHNIPINDYSKTDYINGELQGSIDAIEKHFGKPPIAFIWPGGGFSKKAVEMARALGYRIGFTTNPRGPILFNWIPQAKEKSEAHTDWLPEIPAGDPLMTLPRYWGNDAISHMDDVVKIGQQAAQQAEEDKDTELDYYDIVCRPVTGAIPTKAP